MGNQQLRCHRQKSPKDTEGIKWEEESVGEPETATNVRGRRCRQCKSFAKCGRPRKRDDESLSPLRRMDAARATSRSRTEVSEKEEVPHLVDMSRDDGLLSSDDGYRGSPRTKASATQEILGSEFELKGSAPLKNAARENTVKSTPRRDAAQDRMAGDAASSVSGCREIPMEERSVSETAKSSQDRRTYAPRICLDEDNWVDANASWKWRVFVVDEANDQEEMAISNSDTVEMIVRAYLKSNPHRKKIRFFIRDGLSMIELDKAREVRDYRIQNSTRIYARAG